MLRLVEFPDGSGRVEVKKAGEDWKPGGDVASVMLGTPATPEVLAKFGYQKVTDLS